MYRNVLTLNSRREITAGNPSELAAAVGRAADLRVFTIFNYEEHVNPGAPGHDPVKEVCEFRTTYLIEKRFAAGIMMQRMPITPPHGFGETPSWSFFIYNQDGHQAIARPFLDQVPRPAPEGEVEAKPIPNMPKYHTLSSFDEKSNAPCSNFIYDFEEFRYLVQDEWQEIFAHDRDGNTTSGSLDAFTDAFAAGVDFKVGVSGLFGRQECELFTHAGPGYYNTATRVFSMGTQTVTLVEPGIPLAYASGNWSFGNLFLRNDGYCEYWRCDPYTLKYDKICERAAVRYFVRAGR